MMMRLILILALALGLWAGAPGRAKADPITATFAAISTWMAANAAVVALIQIGASIIGNMMMRSRQSSANQERQGSVTQLQMGEVYREVLFGRECTGGSLVWGWNDGGKGYDNETVVIALADHLCDALEGLYVDDVYRTFTADGAVAGESGLSVYWRNGAEGQTFPASLRTLAGFSTNDRLTGVAYVVVRYTVKWAEARGGRARFRFVVRGKRCYDARKDSTVPGGSGAHRWATPSTWEWTENAEVCLYNWRRGIYALDRVTQADQLLVGRGLSALEAPPEASIGRANICDELVGLRSGGSELRYRVGGTIRSSDAFIDVETWFEAAMAGTIVQPEGGVQVDPGVAKTPALFITDADLFDGDPIVFREFKPGPKRVNSVLARYTEPSQRWNDHGTPIRRNLTDVLADGPEEETLPLLLVKSGTQAQRIAEIRRRRRRLERTAQITLPPRLSGVEEGDWIVWTSDRYTEGLPIAFEVQGYSIGEARRTRLSLEEISASCYSWTPATDEMLPGVAAPSVFDPTTAVGLAGVTFQGIMKGGLPGIRATYAIPVPSEVLGVRIEIRELGKTQATPTATNNLDGELETTNGVAPGKDIQVRLVPLAPPHIPVTPTAWIGMTAEDILAGKLSDGDGGVLDPDDVRNDKNIFSPSWSKRGFSSLSDMGFVALTTSFPEGQGRILMTPTAGFPAFSIATPPIEGFANETVRLHVKADGPITAAQWEGIVRYQTAGHGYVNTHQARIPFPPGGLPVGRYKAIDIDMRELEFGGDDWSVSTINGLRINLQKSSGPGIHLNEILVGTRSSDPTATSPRTRYFDDDGRLFDANGLPWNVMMGEGATISPVAPLAPGATPHTSIAVSAMTVTMPGVTFSLPSATLAGLSADTAYAVFRDLVAGTYVAVSSGTTSYKTNPRRFLYLGVQITAVDAGGGYSPPPPSPPGVGGGYRPIGSVEALP